MKRIAALILAICTLVPAFALVSEAGAMPTGCTTYSDYTGYSANYPTSSFIVRTWTGCSPSGTSYIEAWALLPSGWTVVAYQGVDLQTTLVYQYTPDLSKMTGWYVTDQGYSAVFLGYYNYTVPGTCYDMHDFLLQLDPYTTYHVSSTARAQPGCVWTYASNLLEYTVSGVHYTLFTL